MPPEQASALGIPPFLRSVVSGVAAQTTAGARLVREAAESLLNGPGREVSWTAGRCYIAVSGVHGPGARPSPVGWNGPWRSIRRCCGRG